MIYNDFEHSHWNIKIQSSLFTAAVKNFLREENKTNGVCYAHHAQVVMERNSEKGYVENKS